MEQVRTHVDNSGRILIPAQIRKELHIKSGDVYVTRIIDDEIHLVSLKKVIKEAQQFFRQYIPAGTSMIAEVQKQKEEELSIEARKYDKYTKKDD